MPTLYHGPDWVENNEGGKVVYDVPAGVTFLIGTAPIQEVHATPAARANFVEKDIVIRKKEDAVAAFGDFNIAGDYSIPNALHAIFNKDRGNGVGTIVVRNVFNPDDAAHQDNGTPDPSLVTPANLIGGMNGNEPHGLEATNYLYQKFGWLARRIIAPRFSHDQSIRTKMLLQAQRTKGHAIADLPSGLSLQQILQQRGVGQPYQIGDDRLVLCAPHAYALDPVTGGESLQPLSQHYAGVWNEVSIRAEGDDDGGPAAQASNRPMNDVYRPEMPLTWFPSNYSSDTQLLNDAGIVTMNNGQWGGKILTWGNRASSHPASSDVTQFTHVRQIFDLVEWAVQWFLLPYIDRRGSLDRLELIEAQVQNYLNRKIRDNWFYGAEFRFAKALNTAEEVAQGHFHFQLKWAPISVMEWITTHSFVDLSMIGRKLNLTSFSS